VQTVVVTVERPDLTLARVVREALGEVSWNRARELCRSGRVLVDDEPAMDPARRVATGARVKVQPNAPRARKGVLPAEALVYADGDLVVVDKPAGILSVPFDAGDRDTLIDITRAALRRHQTRASARRDISLARASARFDPELGIVHRLDVDTTGLLLFTRNLAAKRALSLQFRAHTVHRRYLALVHGSPIGRSFDTLLVRDRGDGLRGSWGHFRRPRGNPPDDAQRAISHVRVLERFAGASLVECALETGRQHQIRIHLSEAGHPLLGERVYVRDYRGPVIAAHRPMLHARELGFSHPRDARPLRFTVEPPRDFQTLLAALQEAAP
jgi:23S rRNA pseudouridine1911/1915/1917 synthase